ncbi:MAG TPA: MIP family channel protein [Gemmatimonadales bacterium]|nr:MIP family channel protein [Gemmatimonadales bacterium]
MLRLDVLPTDDHVMGPRLAAESVGTFFLVLIGPGTAAVNAWTHGAPGPVGVALAFGCVLVAAVYMVGHVSGAHFNPAVTTAFGIGRRMPWREVWPYILAQLTGAVLAAMMLRLMLGAAARAAVTLPSIPPPRAFLLEVVLSLFLMLVIMAVATDARVAGPVAGIAVGLAVAGDALMGGPLTGASMNPARSFGPALATGEWTAHWIYWAGPVLGMALAVVLYDYIRRGTAHDHRR